MPQTALQRALGYLRITVDCFIQRLVIPPPRHPVFTSPNYLASRTAIVTGANTGIGLETARALAAAGASVTLACRSLSKARAAAADIVRTHPAALLHVAHLDLACLDSVRAFAAAFLARSHPVAPAATAAAATELHLLVLNGGVMGAPRAVPETHFSVNHVGHALLTLLLLGPLRAARGRVVVVSSLTVVVSDLRLGDVAFARRRYAWMTAYANSKLCMVLFMRALVRRLEGSGVCVNAVHPGEATSDVARNLGRVWMWLHQHVGKLALLSASEAARTSVYVGGAKEMEGVTGGVWQRGWQVLRLPERLVGEEDVQRCWEVTLEAAGASKGDLKGLEDIELSCRE